MTDTTIARSGKSPMRALRTDRSSNIAIANVFRDLCDAPVVSPATRKLLLAGCPRSRPPRRRTWDTTNLRQSNHPARINPPPTHRPPKPLQRIRLRNLLQHIGRQRQPLIADSTTTGHSIFKVSTGLSYVFKPARFTSSFLFSARICSIVSRVPREAASLPRMHVNAESTARGTVSLAKCPSVTL